MRLGYATGAAISATALVIGMSAITSAAVADTSSNPSATSNVVADDGTDPTDTTTPSDTDTTTPSDTDTSTDSPTSPSDPPSSSTDAPPSSQAPPSTHPPSAGHQSTGHSSTGTASQGKPALSLSGSAWLARDANGNGRIDAGDAVAYGFTVRNTGSVTLHGASVASSTLSRFGASVSCPSSSFGPGQSVRCTSSAMTISAFQARHGGATVHAKGSATSSTGRRVSDTTTVQVGVTPMAAATHRHSARMSLTQTVAARVDHNHNGILDKGDEVRFGYTIRNTGATTLSGIVVSSNKLTRSGVTVSCGSTTLYPGQSTSCTSSALVLTAGQAARGLGKTYAKAVGRASDGRTVNSNVSVVSVSRLIPGAKVKKSTVTWNPWPDTEATGSLIAAPSRESVATQQLGSTYDVGSGATPVLIGIGGLLGAGLALTLLNRGGRWQRRRMATTLRTVEPKG